MNIVYIAHPIKGDVDVNLQKIVKIARRINLKEKNTMPLAPYFLDLHALDDSVQEERLRGIKNGTEFLTRFKIDEMRLYGGRISDGMFHEVILAHRRGIPVRPMTAGTKSDYKLMFNK